MRGTIKEVSIVGAGRVGITYACSLARRGIKVHLYEKDPAKRRLLSKQILPFHEPTLEHFFRRESRKQSIQLADSTSDAVNASDATFVAVGTPSLRSGQIDLSQVRRATAEVGRALSKKQGYHTVVIQSTVIPSTTVNVVKPILERCSSKRVGSGFGLATQPEFLREGSAVYDASHPSRIVIGAVDKRSEAALVALAKRVHGKHTPPIVRTTPTTAEMTKYASNAFLAAKLSFVNEIAELCELSDDVDVVEVAEGVGLDPRIGREFLGAGIGFGGSCLPKDLAALISHARSVGIKPQLLESIRAVNKRQPYRAVQIAKHHLGRLKGRRAAVLGLTFKPETDDLRSSPSIAVVRILLREGCKVSVYDPKATREAEKILDAKVRFARNALDCVRGADCCFICTPWREFASLDLRKVAHAMRIRLIVDGRRLYDPEHIPKGVTYQAIGLGKMTAITSKRSLPFWPKITLLDRVRRVAMV